MSENKIEENNKKQDSSETKMDEPIESSENNSPNEDGKEISLEEKLKISEDKLLRSLAEIENQRMRF
jgi:molecular chaperone GrpE (heat shock protein)